MSKALARCRLITPGPDTPVPAKPRAISVLLIRIHPTASDHAPNKTKPRVSPIPYFTAHTKLSNDNKISSTLHTEQLPESETNPPLSIDYLRVPFSTVGNRTLMHALSMWNIVAGYAFRCTCLPRLLWGWYGEKTIRCMLSSRQPRAALDRETANSLVSER